MLPAVLVLNRALSERLLEVKFAMPLVKALQASPHKRFLGLFRQVNVTTTIPTEPTAISEPLDNEVYVMAAVLDPKYSFMWLQDHPGNQQTKDNLQSSITGTFHFLYLLVYIFLCFVFVGNLPNAHSLICLC